MVSNPFKVIRKENRRNGILSAFQPGEMSTIVANCLGQYVLFKSKYVSLASLCIYHCSTVIDFSSKKYSDSTVSSMARALGL